MLEILDHQTVLEQNLENNLIIKTKEVIFGDIADGFFIFGHTGWVAYKRSKNAHISIL